MSGRGQLGFAEAFVSPGLGSNRKLDRLDALIDWSPLERLASAGREGATRPETAKRTAIRTANAAANPPAGTKTAPTPDTNPSLRLSQKNPL